jgi:hypothetical protein
MKKVLHSILLEGPAGLILFLLILDRSCHQSAEQGMGTVGTTLKFRMSLGSHEEGMVGKLDHLHDMAIRRQAG